MDRLTPQVLPGPIPTHNPHGCKQGMKWNKKYKCQKTDILEY